VHKDIYLPFVEALQKEVEGLVVGDGLEAGVTIGPLINKEAKDKVRFLLQDALQKGAEMITGKELLDDDGLFCEPIVITNCTPSMELSKEEIFGPILAIYIFDKDEAVINLANNTPYGLAAYFFTQNINRCWKTMEQLQYGMIGINEGLISHQEAPFGGIKESGFGKEGGRYGLEEYLITKYVCLNTRQ